MSSYSESLESNTGSSRLLQHSNVTHSNVTLDPYYWVDAGNDRNLTYRMILSAEIIGLFLIYMVDVAIIIGNLLVIVAFLHDPQLRITRNYYIYNLAVCDLLLGAVVIPLYSATLITGDWPLGDVLCFLWNFVNNVCLATSHVTIVLITYDRYVLVQRALWYHAFETPKRANVRIGLTWTVVAVVKFIFVLYGEKYYGLDKTEPSCSPTAEVEIPYIIGMRIYDVVFTTISICLEVILPLIFILYWNVRVFKTLRNRKRKKSAVANILKASCALHQIMANVNLNMIPSSNQDKPLDKAGDNPSTSQKVHHVKLHKRHSSNISNIATLEKIDEENKVSLILPTSDSSTSSSAAVRRKTAVVASPLKQQLSPWSLRASAWGIGAPPLPHRSSHTHAQAAEDDDDDDDDTILPPVIDSLSWPSLSEISVSSLEDPFSSSDQRAEEMDEDEDGVVNNGNALTVYNPNPLDVMFMQAKGPTSTSVHVLKTGENPESIGSQNITSSTSDKTVTVADPAHTHPHIMSSSSSSHAVKSVSKPHLPPLKTSDLCVPEHLPNSIMSPVSAHPPQINTTSPSHQELQKQDIRTPNTTAAPDVPQKQQQQLQRRHRSSSSFSPPTVRFTDNNGTATTTTRPGQQHPPPLRHPAPGRKSVTAISKYKKQQDRKTVFLIVCYVIGFLLIKLPLAVVLLVRAVCGTDSCVSIYVYELITWIYWTKSLANPFLYAFISRRFRMYCGNLIKRICCCCCKSKRPTRITPK